MLAALRWQHVVLDHDVPHLHVKASLSTALRFTPPKTKNGKRKVPLTRLAVEALDESGPLDPLFPRAAGKH